jgi:hypothetical protein
MADQTLDESTLTIGTTSCFLPGTNIQFAWDSTSLGMIKTCPRLYQLTMIEGWVPKDESVHLRFGIEYHTALQDYDTFCRSGMDHKSATVAVVRGLLERTTDWTVDRETKAGKYKNHDTLVSLVIDYLDHYIDDPAKTYIKSDGQPAVELSFRFELSFGPVSSNDEVESGEAAQPYILCGHLDRVVEFNDQLLVMDHKTTTTTPGAYYFAQYEPNNQMSLYTLAGQIILGTPIKGVCISAAQILLEKPHNFIRGFTFRTPNQTQEWIDDTGLHLLNAENYAKLDYWPMNDTACDKFGGCKFRGICSKDPEVREVFLRSDFHQQAPEDRWNPLRSR